MNQKMKTGLLAAGLVVLIGGSFFAYNRLKDQVKPEGSGLMAIGETMEAGETVAMAEGSEEAGKSGSVTGSGQDMFAQAAEAVDEANETEGEGASETEDLLAPDITIQDAEGNDVKLSEIIARGKPIVINFWASWCPPCKSEMPEFEKVWKEMGEDVEFLMVNMTDGARETLEKATAYVEEMGYEFPVYYDVHYDAMYNYGVYSLPTTYFIDKDGYVITGAQGAIDEETLRLGISYIYEGE